MRKDKPPILVKPQRFAWSTHVIVDTYGEADAIRNALKQPHKKVCLQRGRYHVKIGTAVKPSAETSAE